MAGGHNTTLHEDPALTKYAQLNTNRYRFFRWTPRTAKLSFIYVIAVPAVVVALGFATDGKYHLRGKRRGDVISEY
ncbi:hypothetical protein EDC01DRAFT_778088 [Geopyxis carbonaria]|nr:hypothetical protein EDC01DRAFT_778088 [Geopyxis carbonaria]